MYQYKHTLDICNALRCIFYNNGAKVNNEFFACMQHITQLKVAFVFKQNINDSNMNYEGRSDGSHF